MTEWNAKRDLSPEHFAIFSAQYTHDFERYRNHLARARRGAADCEANAQYYAKEINRLKIAAAKHGVELPE